MKTTAETRRSSQSPRTMSLHDDQIKNLKDRVVEILVVKHAVASADPEVQSLLDGVDWLVAELDAALTRERRMRRAIETSCECNCPWCMNCIERLSVFRQDH